MASRIRKPHDFISMACTSANVSYREILTSDELAQALTSGDLPRNRFAHFLTLFEEAPEPLLRGLLDQMCESHDRERIKRNFLKIAHEVETEDRVRRILG
jgi:hypothetical protein